MHGANRLAVGPATVDFVPLADAAQRVCDGAIFGDVHLVNAYTLALAEERRDLADALAGDTTNLPDGMPLVWWGRRRGVAGAERVYGPDLMEAVLDRGRQHGVRHYLYGSTPEVLAALEAAIAQRWPGADVVGSESPPFRELTDDELHESADRARALGATVVWVGMGTPKQDVLTRRFSDISPLTFIAIGAAFDFIAGTKSQAPRWVMKLGMEWCYRLVTEPRRLWKRYLIYNIKFLRLLWASRSNSPIP